MARAVPEYLGARLDPNELPTGHRFGMYFDGWLPSADQAQPGGRARGEARAGGLAEVTRPSAVERSWCDAIRHRQRQVAATAGDWMLAIRSTAPFQTGLGQEHPTENGFAFLNPYGIPVLTGAGIKGVVRRAAEELALGLWAQESDWDFLAVWRLFGFDATSGYLAEDPKLPEHLQPTAAALRSRYLELVPSLALRTDEVEFFINCLSSEQRKRLGADHEAFLASLPLPEVRRAIHNRGALHFWDAPLSCPSLCCEVLTPHHTGYFQKGTTPAEFRPPVPVQFLSVPPGASAWLFVRCDPEMAGPLAPRWQALLGEAVDLACRRLGFGAKTAVGYGRFEPDERSQQELVRYCEGVRRDRIRLEEQRRHEAAETARKAALDPFELKLEEEIAKLPKDLFRSTALVRVGDSGVFAGRDLKRLAELARDAMKRDGVWREQPSNNTALRKKYEATQRVIAWLNLPDE